MHLKVFHLILYLAPNDRCDFFIRSSLTMPAKHLILLLTCSLCALCRTWGQCDFLVQEVARDDSLIHLKDRTCLYVDKSALASVGTVFNIMVQEPTASLSNYRVEGRFQRARYAYWMRFDLRAEGKDTLHRILSCSIKDTLDLYFFVGDSLISHQKAGRRFTGHNDSERYFLLGKHFFPVSLPPNQTLTLLLRARSKPMMEWDFAPRLHAPFALAQFTAPKLFRYYFLNGIIFGFLLFVMLFAFAQYVLHKNRAALFYNLYILTIAVFLARVFYIRDYFFFPLPHDLFRFYYNLPLNYASYIFYFLFINSFLDARKSFPFLHKFIKWSVGAFMAALLLHGLLMLYDEWWALKVGYIWRSVFSLVALYMTYLTARRVQNPLYKFALVGSGVLLLSLLVSLGLSWTPNNIVGLWWDIADIPVLIGLMVEITCFTIGLAYKSRLVEIEKSQAQAALELEHDTAMRLQELDQAKTRLFANITHEFRTPLTIIGGMAEQIAQNPEHWAKEGAGMIRKNSIRLLRLVNQMLNLSKLESGAMQLRLVRRDVVAYLKYLFESFHSLGASKNISMHFESGIEVCEMDYDPDSLEQIIQNLLSNAVRHTPEGGMVCIRLTASDANLIIQVEDTGSGIPADQLPFIFDRFYQATHPETFERGNGAGIGLALVKEWVSMLKGTVTVSSLIDKGSTFTVILPLQQAVVSPTPAAHPVSPDFSGLPQQEDTSLSPDTMSQALVSEPSKMPLVLLVEDNADMLRYLEICLAEWYQIIKASDGGEGLAQAFEYTPDLIVSDVMMPQMNGFQLCNTLKNDLRTSHIPVVLLTAKADFSSRMEGLKHGADVYLAKPFTPQELHLQIKNLLALRGALQHYYNALVGNEVVSHLPAGSPEEEQFLSQLRETVLTHLSDFKLTVPFLCRSIGMSKSSLHRKLHALTGAGAHQFITGFRLAKACELLLADSSVKLATIAYECGFNDPDYFTKVFKEKYGQTPSEWRERCRQ